MDALTSPTAAPAQGPAANPAASSSGTTDIASDFDTFLRLLTAQIENQDPLEPMKSEEFAVQLATFSNVEQAVKTNDLLEAILAGGGSDQFTTMSGWIGKEVRAPMAVQFDGQPITIDPQPPAAGNRHDLVVSDAAGNVVDRRQISSTGEPLNWSGNTAGGQTAADGVYRFTVESFENGTLVATEPAPVYAQVTEIRYAASGPVLVFDGGVEADATGVSAIRQSPDA